MTLQPRVRKQRIRHSDEPALVFLLWCTYVSRFFTRKLATFIRSAEYTVHPPPRPPPTPPPPAPQRTHTRLESDPRSIYFVHRLRRLALGDRDAAHRSVAPQKIR